jgi:hypothetical protein
MRAASFVLMKQLLVDCYMGSDHQKNQATMGSLELSALLPILLEEEKS